MKLAHGKATMSKDGSKVQCFLSKSVQVSGKALTEV